MNQQSCMKRGNVLNFIKEINIFNRKLESSYVENLLRSLISIRECQKAEMYFKLVNKLDNCKCKRVLHIESPWYDGSGY